MGRSDVLSAALFDIFNVHVDGMDRHAYHRLDGFCNSFLHVAAKLKHADIRPRDDVQIHRHLIVLHDNLDAVGRLRLRAANDSATSPASPGWRRATPGTPWVVTLAMVARTSGATRTDPNFSSDSASRALVAWDVWGVTEPSLTAAPSRCMAPSHELVPSAVSHRGHIIVMPPSTVNTWPVT